MTSKLPLCFLLTCVVFLADGFSQQDCVKGTEPVVIFPDAPVFIAVLLDVRQYSKIPSDDNDGVPKKEQIEYFEGLKYAIGLINQKSGEVSSRLVRDSFIAGVQIGLQVFDTCDDASVTRAFVASLFQSQDTNLLAIFDGSEIISKNQDIAKLVAKRSIQVLPLVYEDVISTQDLGEATFRFLRELGWDRLSAVEKNPSKLLSYLTGKSSLCFQKVIAENDCFRSDSPFIVFDTDICDAFPENSVVIRSRSLTELEFKELVARGVKRVFVVSVFPKDVTLFEAQWSKKKRLNLVSSVESKWSLEYLMKEKKCRLSGYKTTLPELLQYDECTSLYFSESDFAKIARKERVVASFNAVNTVAFGLRRAWENKCHSVPGFCSDLQSLSPGDFQELFLKRLEFYNDGPGARTPSGVSGGKMRTSPLGELKGAKFVMMEYKIDRQKLIAEQIFLKDDGGVKKMAPDFVAPSFRCSSGGCSGCQRGVRSIPSLVAQQLLESVEDLAVAGTEIAKSQLSTVPSPLDKSDDPVLTIVIPALLPVHLSGPTALQCGTAINQEAIYGVEALLWALDQINRQEHILPGIELGTIVLDTCSSPVKTTRILSGLLAKSDDSSMEELGLKSGQIVAAIAALRGQDARVANDLLTQDNVTSVNALSQAIARDNGNKYAVEVDVSYSKIALAVVKLLKKLDIMKVTAIYSVEDEELSFGFRQFRTLCDSHDVLVANIEPISRDVRVEEVLNRFKEESSSRENSRWGQDVEGEPQVIVTWLTEEDADNLMAALVSNKNILKRNFLVGIGNYWEAFSKDPDFSKAVSGAVFFNSDWSPVRDFVEHFRGLKPNDNDRNPWFYEYWEQNSEDTSCPDESEEGSCAHSKIHDSFIDIATVGARMIQSVFLLASSLVRVQKEACHGNKKMEDCSIERFYDRQLLNEFIRKTGTDRVDLNGTDFRLTAEGYGDIPVAIWNVRRMPPQETIVGSPVIMKRIGVFDNKLKLDGTVVTYNRQGQETPVADLFGKTQNTQPTTPASTTITSARKISIITRTRPVTTTEAITEPTEEITTATVPKLVTTVYTTSSVAATTSVDCLRDSECRRKMQSFNPAVKAMQVVQSETDYTLIALIPIQDKGQDIFTCGQMSNPSNFLLAAIFAYTIEQVNQNSTFPKINGIVLDYCNSTERAHERIFSALSGDLKSRNYVQVSPQSIVGAIFLDLDVSRVATSMLSEEHIPSVVVPLNNRLENKFLPSIEQEMAVYVDVFLEFGWNTIAIFHSNSKIGIYKLEILKKLLSTTSVCVVDEFVLDNTASKEMVLRSLYSDEATLKQVTIAVILLDNAEQYDIVQAALHITKQSEDYVTVVDENLTNGDETSKLVIIRMETQDVKGFSKFVNDLTLADHQPIPSEWFEQFYQHYHKCTLPTSSKAVQRYGKICGVENVTQLPSDNSYNAIYSVVTMFATKLQEFLEECPDRRHTRSMLACGRNAKESFSDFFNEEMAELKPDYGFDIFVSGFSKSKKVRIGTHKNDKLELTKFSELNYKFWGIKCESEYCDSQCKSVSLTNSTSLSSMAGEFKSDFGVAASTISIIGILLTFVLTGHLFSRFPINQGSTIVDYFILLGVTLLFISNFLHLFTAMVGTCILRRLVCDLGYAVIFSGFLVKVIAGCKDKGDPPLFENSNIRASVVTLSSSTLGLATIQLILTVSWLFVMPPKISSFHNSWHCNSMEGYHAELAVSLTYVVILVGIVAVFSAVVLYQGLHDFETLWILGVNTACLVVLLTWAIIATQMNYFYRVSVVIMCNLLNCALVLIYVVLKVLSQNKKNRNEMNFEPSSSNSTSSAFASADDIYYEAKNIISSDTTQTLSPEELGLTSMTRYNPLYPENGSSAADAHDMLNNTHELRSANEIYDHLRKVHEARASGKERTAHEMRESCWITPESTLRRNPAVLKRNKSIRDKTEVPTPVFPRDGSTSPPPPLPERNVPAGSRTYSRTMNDSQELPNEIPEVYPETGSWRRHFPTLHSRRQQKRPPMPVPEQVVREPVFPPGPQVRMVGDRHILLLGDETLSRHGRVSKI